ncbi:hypothetical protein N0V93_004058 [Gnomoniopsis smithogilvyi]|uniref:Dienelactone hydrolase n=1 Tax=Gnomoniopsis smithogilvyi TaxID=1191159 RepID=A0A9W8YZT8_9PEZI|nr:hypothetical protein N0V93_004058 [Gnomoniopsis smithogilvyi]
MNIALPERAKGKNAVVLSQNGGSNHNDPHFLSEDFLKDPPRLFITAEDNEFDMQTITEWQDEGFLVEYVPMGSGGEKYVERLERAGKKKLGPCESYGIVAYGEAASFLLEHYHVHANNDLKLRLLIAYYPSRIPDPLGKFPSNIHALVHLAGSEVGLVKHSQMVGIQGKRRLVKRILDPGIGAGKINKLAYHSYTYNADPGFAEHDIDDYDKISADLAWSRSLAAARKAFNRAYPNIELLVDENHQGKFHTRNTQAVLSSYTTHKTPSATYFPTLTGGVGPDDLQRFYNDYFIYANPPSLNLTLISRTIGADRVVDEMHVTFKHTHEIPWMLPGVPPTGKRVEVMVVSIVSVRAGKLYSEHVYWDQASVLFQIGLLDPALLPKKARKLGAEELPVVGRDAARRVLRGMGDVEEGQADNELIPGWYSDTEESEEESDEEEEEEDGEREEEEEEEFEDEAAGSDRPNGKSRNGLPAKGKVVGEEKERRSRSKGPSSTTSTK